MDEPFYYRSAEDRVPRDAVYVIIGGSITVVEPRIFQGHRNLARVELREGVVEIGREAFFGCPNLARVDCPSSLRAIGDRAFLGCEGLSEAILREGLEEIGERAFNGCDLRRVTVPSSVMQIGEFAFSWCHRLSEVTLAGGTVMLARGAFNCHGLSQIAISSMAIVVEAGEDGDVRVAAVTGGIQQDATNRSPQLILSPPHLELVRPENLTNLTDAIDRIADLTRGAEPSDLADGDVSGRIRDCFADHLSTWYRWYRTEVATILELGLWKIELGRAREASRGLAVTGEEVAGTDVPTRDDCRRTCGAEPIVGLVLSSLAGPHRRADQLENEGSVQL